MSVFEESSFLTHMRDVKGKEKEGDSQVETVISNHHSYRSNLHAFPLFIYSACNLSLRILNQQQFVWKVLWKQIACWGNSINNQCCYNFRFAVIQLLVFWQVATLYKSANLVESGEAYQTIFIAASPRITKKTKGTIGLVPSFLIPNEYRWRSAKEIWENRPPVR